MRSERRGEGDRDACATRVRRALKQRDPVGNKLRKSSAVVAF